MMAPLNSLVRWSNRLEVGVFHGMRLNNRLNAEFLVLMARKTKDIDSEKEIAEAFKVFDRDNDGFVSTEELARVMASIGETLTDEEIKEILCEADTDGDGKISCMWTLLIGEHCETIETDDLDFQMRNSLGSWH